MGQWPLRFMVYAAGESISGAAGLAPQISEQLQRLSTIATNRSLVALAELGQDTPPVVRWILDPDRRYQPEPSPNANVGTPDELVSFVTWCNVQCDAVRNVLILSGHGAAWEDAVAQLALQTRALRIRGREGALVHRRNLFGSSKTASVEARAVLVDGADRSYLSNAQLGAACDRVSQLLADSRVDCLVFDACLMSSWEVLSELEDRVTTVVASVDELSANGVDYATPAIAMSRSAATLSPQEIAQAIVKSFVPAASFDTCVAMDLSSPSWKTATDFFRAFCTGLAAWLGASSDNRDAFRHALRIASSSVVRFIDGGLADVGGLLSAVEDLASLPATVTQSLAESVTCLKACVLGASLGKDYKDALGLSVFSPPSYETYIANRPEYTRLQLPTTTGWSRCLDVAFEDAQ